jgi:hypothetical protein
MASMHILDYTGDRTLTWDPSTGEGVESARAAFNAKRKDGYWGYALTGPEHQAEVIKTFDPLADHIVVRPQLVGG